ncbi:hypothetical protein JZO70_10770 [Enterococcus sp. 669A]|uniref:Uncharacterized protein n=1 Tax=Candidatus Enterococcus moelleringii TaxID=2815325 RepID=A0ABS3LAK7_9ENTE|nr:hypothetical protein [Enterococcus sp. 669A]MBO1306647.1 hypothetical protein [Enterococcus sp. 669A]
MAGEKKTTSTERNKRWQEKNPERSKYLRRRTDARGFIKNWAKEADLIELENLMTIRRKQLVDGTAENADV